MKYLLALLVFSSNILGMQPKPQEIDKLVQNLDSLSFDGKQEIPLQILVEIIKHPSMRQLFPPIETILDSNVCIHIEAHKRPPEKVSFRAGNKLLAVGGEFAGQNLIPLFLCAHKKKQQKTNFSKISFVIGKNNQSPITHIAIAPKKPFVALARKNMKVNIYRVNSKSTEPISTLEFTSPISKIAFDKTGNFLIYEEKHSKIMLYDINNHRRHLISSITRISIEPQLEGNHLFCNTKGVTLPEKASHALPIKFICNQFDYSEAQTLVTYLQFQKTKSRTGKKLLINNLLGSTLEKPVKYSLINSLKE